VIISPDTNVWVFGFLGKNSSCEKIMMNLPRFKIIVPNQIRAELERNLPRYYMHQFYLLALQAGVQFDFEHVPQSYLSRFEKQGLKKGDLVIGAFCEWRKVDRIVSANRDFLRGNHMLLFSIWFKYMSSSHKMVIFQGDKICAARRCSKSSPTAKTQG
jgi:hypothetical protein